MERYAWIRDGEPQFEVGHLDMSSQRSPFADNGAGAERFKHYQKNNQSVGILILPRGGKCRASSIDSATAYMMGVNNLVPDGIDVVLVVALPDFDDLKFDPRRKMLSYSKNHRILLDLDVDGDALYSKDDINLNSEGQWAMSDRLVNEDDDFAMAYSAARTLGAEEALFQAILGVAGSSASDLTTLLEKCESEDEKQDVIAAFKGERERVMQEADTALKDLSFDTLSAPFGTGTDDLINRFVSALPNANGFGKFCMMGSQRTPQWNLNNKRAYDMKAAGAEFCPVSKADARYVEALEQMTEKADALRLIWNKELHKEHSIVTLPENLCRMAATPEQRSVAGRTLRMLGEQYGINYIVESYVGGVPIEDIMS